jgi:hypothetical protein
MSGHAAVSHGPTHTADVPLTSPVATLPSQRFHPVPPRDVALRSQIWSPTRLFPAWEDASGGTADEDDL